MVGFKSLKKLSVNLRPETILENVVSTESGLGLVIVQETTESSYPNLKSFKG